MKKEFFKKFIFSIVSITVTVAVVITAAFAWFTSSKKSANLEISGDADISVQGYILKYYQSDTVEEDRFLSENDRYPIDFNTSETLTGNSGALDNLDNKNYLKFVFIITNNNLNYDCNLSMRLSNFSNYIFSYYDDYVTEYNSVNNNRGDSFSKKDGVADVAHQYNAKFSLYFSDIEYCVGNDYDPSETNTFSKGTTMTSITQEKDPFLWNYSSGDRIINSNDVLIPKNNCITLTFKIKTQQSNESITNYRSWVVSNYGREYLAINKYDNSYDNLTTQQKNYITDYLNYFVDSEIKTIFTESTTVMQETKLLIDYFEFIGESNI